MSNTWFRFKQFTIHQQAAAMKVGTDGVLLGALADVHNARTALDIGTGTGLIALMLKQRNPQLQVTAIDVEKEAVEQATGNAALSPWEVEVLHVSAQAFALSGRRFDRIVCNPPYFCSSLKAPDAARSLARHNDSLPFGELLAAVDRLLAPDGQCWVILPYDAASAFSEKGVQNALHTTQAVTVVTKPGKAPKRMVLCLERGPRPLLAETLVIENDKGGYTERYAALVHPFYLDKTV